MMNKTKQPGWVQPGNGISGAMTASGELVLELAFLQFLKQQHAEGRHDCFWWVPMGYMTVC